MSKVRSKELGVEETYVGKRPGASAEEASSKSPIMRLVILRGGSKGRAYHLEQGENLIGRWDPDAGAFPEVDLEAEDAEAKVSRRHAMIIRDGDRAFLKDLSSLNGTFINRSTRLKAEEIVEIKSGDELIVGKTFLRFEVGPE